MSQKNKRTIFSLMSTLVAMVPTGYIGYLLVSCLVLKISGGWDEVIRVILSVAFAGCLGSLFSVVSYIRKERTIFKHIAAFINGRTV